MLDSVIDTQALAMRTLTRGLLDGTVSLSQWQLVMMQTAKAINLVGTSVAVGGWNQLGPEWAGFAGQRIRQQYAYLRDFAADIASGRQKLDGTLLARSELYAHAARQTHRAAQERLARSRGMEEEANRLGAADHCSGCLSATAQGWVPLGTLVPCGSRQCLSRCHCSLVFRLAPAA